MCPKRGFTLIELAIAMVIIGLVIAGVFTAQTLNRASKMQTALSEYDSYVKAIGEFQDKYHTLPGDMAGSSGFTPQDIWGLDSRGCPCASNCTVKSKATCNGDANGSIGSSTVDAVLSDSYEWFRAWQQLSDAGFIQGSFTGAPGAAGTADAIIGSNVPASAVTGAGWSLLYFLFPSNGSADNGVLWRDEYGHLLALGGYVSNDYTYGAVLRPDEAYSMDIKMDDGKPGTGKLRAWRATRLANCTVTDTSQTNQAYSTNTTPSCSLAFVLGF